MPRPVLKTIAVTLAVAIVLVLGITSGGAFAHEIKHAAHHSPGMHKTGICAWMCATAGAVITAAIEPAGPLLAHVSVLVSEKNDRSLEFSSTISARAPPVLF